MIDYPKEIHIYVYMYYSNLRVWFNGKIPPCQGEYAGSIPATRSKPTCRRHVEALERAAAAAATAMNNQA